jgi:hypothetical protein
MNPFPIDFVILKQIGLLPIVHQGLNPISWLTAEWLFSDFFKSTKTVFHSEELAAQWRSKSSCTAVVSPLLHSPDADLFEICNGGSVDHCDITNNDGKQIGMYHFHNGCLFHFEMYGIRVDIDALEEKYVELYNKKYDTMYMTKRQYYRYLEAKYGSSNPYKAIPELQTI